MPAKVRRIDFSADEWLAGTRKLTFEQEGFYIRVCALIYSNGGPLPHGDGDLARACRADPRRVDRLLGQLIALGKIRENDDGMLTVPRCEAELTSARSRAEVAAKNAAKRWENQKTHHARSRTREAEATPAEVSEEKPAKPPEENDIPDARARTREAASNGGNFRTSARHRPDLSPKSEPKPMKSHKTPDANHQPSVRKKDLAHKELNPFFLTAREASPPLPSRGDGDAASRASEAPAPTVFDDPALKADAVAMLGHCLDALRAKRGTLDSLAARAPPDPRIVAFRAKLQRLNSLAGGRLDGTTRMQAWETIAQADAIGDPVALPPEMLANLAAIESLEVFTEAAQ